ncbi:insecticidal delta-endotoxin Cry8Ea1 family protein [Bacillus mycoides]|uniref:insecticidal delta-endotoxin Cry8Ea1 family protein n=1 Tax=Bacillus mycoides TaxID=1405 RepID=UPI003D032C2E
MNPYQNKNEYEILDASPNNVNASNRYPFATDPSITLNWNTCSNNPGSGNAIREMIGIMADVFTFLIAPSLPAGIGLLRSMINRAVPSNGASIASLSICDLLSLIRQEVQQSVLDDGVADFNGRLSEYRDRYLPALETWNRDRSNTVARQEVAFRFREMDGSLLRILGGSLSRNNAQILLLPSYAQAANLHLLLLRDANLYGREWGIISPTIDYKQLLLNSIREYTNHCVHWYQQGLNQIRANGTSAQNWLNFNRFRREMTLSVLDLIAIFPTYDPESYPLPTQIELSRLVYTDPTGYINFSNQSNTLWSWFFRSNWADMENRAILLPMLSSELSRLEIFTNRYRNPITYHREYWSGTISWLLRTGGNEIGIASGSRQGAATIFNMHNVDIFRVDLTVHRNSSGPVYGVHRSEFTGVDTLNRARRTFLYNRPYGGGQTQNVSLTFPGTSVPEGNQSDYSHKLAAVVRVGLTGGASNDSGVLSHAWAHKSLNRQNIIDSNRITQIPAVKTSFSSNCTVIPGPGFTGGDLVRLDANGRFDIQVQLPTTQRNYRIRLRYASASTGSINIVFSGASHPSTLPSTTSSLNNLQYENFRYFDVIGTFVSSLGKALSISNLTMNANVVIDKIEFIPVGIFKNQSLEETQGYNNNYNQNSSSMYNQGYNNNYHQNGNSTYGQNYDNYNQNANGMYDDTYYPNNNDSYDQSYTDTYDSGYNNNQNMENTYDQEYENYNPDNNNSNQYPNDMYNQEYNNDYNQNSSCTCKQCYNQNYPK